MIFRPFTFNQYLKQAFEDENADDGENEGENNNTGKKTYTDEELNAIIDKVVTSRLARERKDEEKRSKAQAEAARLEKLTAEQKLQEKADALQAKIAELEAKETKAAMGAAARKILQTSGVTLPDEIVDLLITDNADTTKSQVESFVKTYNKAVEAGVKEALRDKTPRTGATRTGMTKEEIEKISDPIARQRAIRENISLFKH